MNRIRITSFLPVSPIQRIQKIHRNWKRKAEKKKKKEKTLDPAFEVILSKEEKKREEK